MSGHSGIGWRGWSGAGVAGVLAVILVCGLFRLPVAGPAAPVQVGGPATAAVGLVRLRDQADALLQEDATLRDPTPLFLPTRWNAAENALPANARHEPGLSLVYGARLSFSNSVLKLQLPPAVVVPGRPADAFAADQPALPYQGLGETDEPAPSLPPRSGFVEVVAAATGQLTLAQPLLDAQPPTETEWQPLEFLVAVDRGGVVRPPVLTTSSRVAAVDGYFQEYLANELHLGARLAPGFYRVGFGP